MCGICGRTLDADGTAVAAMNRALRHRGPDDEGVYVDRASGLALAARRLSVIDVAGGHQPLSNERADVWAVLNGEIYNHPSLRQHLRERGHQLAEHWAEAIEPLLDDPDRLREMGESGRERALESFSLSAHVDAVVAAYRGVAAHEGPP
jgi:asparagine synthetase B (glutamine-hydrolysing)